MIVVCAGHIGAVVPAAHAQRDGPPMAHETSGAPLIVVDPGHGGGDAGAPGAVRGVHEKAVTLALAWELEQRLSQAGYRVRLTRERDVYLTLRQRVAYANEVGADLFISLHANATQGHSQRGYETFILSRRAMDVDSRALRMQDGADRPGLDEEVAWVLDDVERGLAQQRSAELASRIQAHLRHVRGPEHDRGVRQDSMHVLLGATMPAVLVEVGFIDHPIEGRELLDREVRGRICRALVQAIAATLPSPLVARAEARAE